MQLRARETFVTSGLESISYFVTSEDKPKLVLIHGNNSSGNHWLDVVEKLENNFSICVMDLRGFGESSNVMPIHSIHELAEDVKELLVYLDWTKFVLVGWSLGGAVAMEVAALLPENVEKLVLTASASVYGYPMFEFDMEKKILDITKPLKTLLQLRQHPAYVLPIEMMKATGNRDGLAKILHGLTVAKPVSDDYMEMLVDEIMKQRNLAEANYALLTFNAVGSGVVEKIKAPILLIQGEKDLVVLPIMSQMTKDVFKERAKLVTIENAGHAIHQDQWDAWWSVVKRFIEDVK